MPKIKSQISIALQQNFVFFSFYAAFYWSRELVFNINTSCAGILKHSRELVFMSSELEKRKASPVVVVVSWISTSLFSTNMAISEMTKASPLHDLRWHTEAD